MPFPINPAPGSPNYSGISGVGAYVPPTVLPMPRLAPEESLSSPSPAALPPLSSPASQSPTTPMPPIAVITAAAAAQFIAESIKATIIDPQLNQVSPPTGG